MLRRSRLAALLPLFLWQGTAWDTPVAAETSSNAQSSTLARCLAAPSARLLSLDGSGQAIRLSAAGIAPQKRSVIRAGQRTPIPPRERVPLVRAGPNGGLIYLRDVAGNERYSLAYKPAASGAALQQISPLGARAASPLVLLGSETTIFTSTASQGPLWGLLEHTIGAPLRIVFQQPGAWQAMAASADGKSLLVQEIFGLYDRVLYILDRQSGLKTPLFIGQRPLPIRGAALSSDSAFAYVLLATVTQGGLLVQIDIYNGRTQVLLKTQWPLYALEMSADGKHLAALENRNGQTTLHKLATATPSDILEIDLRGWAYDLRVSETGEAFGLTRERPGVPPHIVQQRFDADTVLPDGPAPCAEAVLTAIDIVRDAPVADTAALPALLIQPTKTTPTPRPLIIAFHGGPEGQWYQGSHLELFALAESLDTAILLPNVVGSTGYGLAYSAADDGKKRAIVLDDIERIIAWARADSRFDQTKIAVIGASYGGYLALLAQSKFNDDLAGAASDVGISDLPRFLSETPITRRALRRAEYGDERVDSIAKALAKLSPRNDVLAITKPIFLSHGVNDARVPLNQSSDLAALLRAQGTPVTYRPVGDEGHVTRTMQKRLESGRAKQQFLSSILYGD